MELRFLMQLIILVGNGFYLVLELLKKRVVYKKTKLRFIALLGIPENLDSSLVKATSELYDFVSMIVRNQVLLENAEKYNNERSFIQMLEGI